jgi:hypothetical protein
MQKATAFPAAAMAHYLARGFVDSFKSLTYQNVQFELFNDILWEIDAEMGLMIER